MGVYSPSSAEKTVVKIEEEGLGAELTNLWQSEFNKVTTTAPEVMNYSAKSISMASTGDLVAFQSASGNQVAAASEQSSSGGLFSWIGGAWDSTTNWVNGAWDSTTSWLGNAWDSTTSWAADQWNSMVGWMGDKADAIMGMISAIAVGGIIAGIIALVGGGLHAGELDKEGSEKSGELDKPSKSFREMVVSVIKFDVNKSINEAVQKGVFGKTFKDIRDMRDDQTKTMRDRIGAALDKTASFDIVNTVVNKPLQKAFLGVTLDTFRKDIDSKSESLNGPSQKLKLRELLAEDRNKDNNKATDSPKGKTGEKASETSESKPASFTARFSENVKTFESGGYRQSKISERNWSVNTRAHILDALVKADINKGINIIAGKAIMGEDIYSVQAEMNQTAKAYKKEMATRQSNIETMATFLNIKMKDLSDIFSGLEQIKMDSKEKASFDKADDAGHKERTNNDDVVFAENKDPDKDSSEETKVSEVTVTEDGKKEDYENLTSYEQDNEQDNEQDTPQNEEPTFENDVDVPVEEPVDPESVEPEEVVSEEVTVEEVVKEEDPVTADEANDKENDNDSSVDVDSEKSSMDSFFDTPDLSEMSGEEYVAFLQDKVEELSEMIWESIGEIMEDSVDFFDQFLEGEDVEKETIELEVEKADDSTEDSPATAEEEVKEEGPAITETAAVEVVDREDTDDVREVTEVEPETTLIENVQDTDDVNRFDSEFVEESGEVEDDREHQTDGNRNENEGRASSHETDKHVD